MISLAIEDIVHGRGRDPSTQRARRARDAAAWIFGRPNAAFPFESACGIIGLDMGRARAAIRAKTGWAD